MNLRMLTTNRWSRMDGSGGGFSWAIKRTDSTINPRTRTSEMLQLLLSPNTQLPEKDLWISAEPVAKSEPEVACVVGLLDDGLVVRGLIV